ncbi:hypothetical protein HJC23_001072 [Cyclotella cryptica]|uniref:Uncharacterized protein n=1 Tax=Cyclotella cryptica TaxID=29204 RepID=A0ABD3QKT2_9STRA
MVISSDIGFGASDTIVSPNLAVFTLAELTDCRGLDGEDNANGKVVLREREIYGWVVDGRNSYSNHVVKLKLVRNRKITMDFRVVKASRELEDEGSKLMCAAEAGRGQTFNIVLSKAVDVLTSLLWEKLFCTLRIPIAPLLKFDTANNPSSHTLNILCPHSSLLHTPQTSHVHLCTHSSINCATSVTSSLLLPHSTIQNGCTVSHSLLQWSSTITSHSDAHQIFLMEQSEIGPHSFTANAIYGPDSHVSGGEVHCTLFEPNANAHHQSLLIGILWGLGRGNVGYGSNMGSNHTGQIPDQETSVGEGTFWGLGSVIKFPVDLTSAPYSIIAAGVQLPPQRIMLPFSLITDGPGMNQLTPGWLLQYSPYTISRSEVKFANCRTAKRHDFYTGWKILRPSVMDLMVNARNALMFVKQEQSSGEGKTKSVFKTDRDIPGLESKRLSYDEVLAHVGLRGIDVDRLASETTNLSNGRVEWPVLPWNEPSHTDAAALWKHQHSMLLLEIPSILGNSKTNDNILSSLLQKCIALEDDHAKQVYQSISRDDSRGASTVPGYSDAHVAAEKDSVVLAAKEEEAEVRREVHMVVAACGVGSSGMARSRL